MINYQSYKLYSTTIDDAAGEAFDKGARLLGLVYPGGAEIEKAAIGGDIHSFPFYIPKVKNNPLNYSFSGIKTALLYKIKDINKDDRIKNLSMKFLLIIYTREFRLFMETNIVKMFFL